jgi:hypothetical protein
MLTQGADMVRGTLTPALVPLLLLVGHFVFAAEEAA